MFKLILADGTALEGFVQNGNNYISKTKVDESLFEGNLSTLTITDGETVIEMHDAELIQQVEFDGEYYLCFREISAEEKANLLINAKIDYIAMMTDVDIEEV